MPCPIHSEQQQQQQQQVRQVREGYEGGCPMTADSSSVQQTGKVMTSCQGCSSIYTTMKDRSPFDQKYLAAYNPLINHYNTNLMSLQFAP